MRIPKLKKLQPKYKKNSKVYFLTRDGVKYGKIVYIFQNISVSQAPRENGKRRSRPFWKKSIDEYNISVNNNNYIGILEYDIFKNLNKAQKKWKEQYLPYIKNRANYYNKILENNNA